MTTFKEFIAEGSDENFHLKTVEAKKAIAVLNTRCKNALWMLEKDTPIWRGESHKSALGKVSSFAIIDPSKTVRYSENTSNWYTEIFDSSPYMKDFPKRSKSLICSFDENIASGYTASSRKPNAVIPFDGVKIGVCPGADVWDTMVKFHGAKIQRASIDYFNSQFELLATDLGIETNEDDLISVLKKMDAKLKKLEEPPKGFTEYFGNSKDDFLDSVYRAYSPSETGMTWYTSSAIQGSVHSYKGREVWVGGPALVISFDTWIDLVEAYKS